MFDFHIASVSHYRRRREWMVRFDDGTGLIVPTGPLRAYARQRQHFAVPPELVAQLATLVGEEATLKDMAQALAVCPQTISSYLRRTDLYDAWCTSRRARALRAHKSRNGVAYQHAETIRAMVRAGHTLQEIGTATGVTRERIRQVLNIFDCNAPRKAVRRIHREQRAIAAWLATPAGAVLAECETQAQAAGYTTERRIRTYPTSSALTVDLLVDGHVVNATWSYIPSSVGGSLVYFRAQQTSPEHILLLATADGQRAMWWPPMTTMVYLHTRDYVAPACRPGPRQRPERLPRLHWTVAETPLTSVAASGTS